MSKKKFKKIDGNRPRDLLHYYSSHAHASPDSLSGLHPPCRVAATRCKPTGLLLLNVYKHSCVYEAEAKMFRYGFQRGQSGCERLKMVQWLFLDRRTTGPGFNPLRSFFFLLLSFRVSREQAAFLLALAWNLLFCLLLWQKVSGDFAEKRKLAAAWRSASRHHRGVILAGCELKRVT